MRTRGVKLGNKTYNRPDYPNPTLVPPGGLNNGIRPTHSFIPLSRSGRTTSLPPQPSSSLPSNPGGGGPGNQEASYYASAYYAGFNAAQNSLRRNYMQTQGGNQQGGQVGGRTPEGTSPVEGMKRR